MVIRINRLKRRIKGNTLVLTLAVTAGVVVLLLLFALGYSRMLGTHAEQKTAIEAAALAAAKDISKIVISDNNFGYISLSDAAPVGRGTISGDNFFVAVNSINSLMGTIRLEMIMADAINNSTMRALARRDLANLKTAKDALVTAINNSLSPGGHGTDFDGHQVTPYQSAEDAYKQNQVRMSGATSYVAGSMRLTLGSLQGGSQTNVPLPKPSSYSNVSANGQMNGYYLSGMNHPYGGENFIFASAGATIKLVDNSLFRSSLGLPYEMPSIIRAEADQKQNGNNGQTVNVTHIAACAQPANVYDPRPAPGAVSLYFPDGVPVELSDPGDFLTHPAFANGQPMTTVTAAGGDYPTGSGSLQPTSWTGPGSPDVSVVWANSIYNWLRRGGPRTSVAAFRNMQSTPFTYTGNLAFGKMSSNVYRIDSNGNIVYDTNHLPANFVDPYTPVSHNQLYATKQDTLTSADKHSYDAHIRDNGYNPGPDGGIHSGEPLTTSVVQNVITTTMMIASNDPAPINIAFDGKSGSGYGCDSGSVGDGAHWMIKIGGPPSALLGGLYTGQTIDGHHTTYFIFANAPDSRNDFGLSGPVPPTYFQFAQSLNPAGQRRPTYLQNGLCAELRLRRCIPLDKFGMTGKKGYGPHGLRIYPPPPVSPILNM